MPFEIVRNDITNMKVDAIVNTANPMPIIGSGVDAGIHKKAGRRLLRARKKIGSLTAGQAAVTPAFALDAKYVIHTVGPVWQGGIHGEEALLCMCYKNSLALAKQHGCESVAFPLISTGNYGFPKPLALQIAINEISRFLMENEMQVYLVVFNKEAFALSENMFESVSGYIDENYIKEKTFDEYGSFDGPGIGSLTRSRREAAYQYSMPPAPTVKESVAAYNVEGGLVAPIAENAYGDYAVEDFTIGLEEFMDKLDAGFSETLLKLIDLTGKKDSEVYKKANVDRKLFSKIRNNPDYKPSKSTALAFAVALELSLDETKDLIARAGYALTHSSKFDIIVEFFIVNKKYDIFELNEVLFAFDQPLIGA